ncbi:tRNA (N6-threonylcarbamoyladenosine(37)-N6)-methyltransferase TrmO [bacterium]|nr:tRNA (N6-threonylcarbamoyladenosine(37)-N6)-methyltransferase TrmO [bacterium]
MDQIIMHPIGLIHSPYKEPKDIPIQGRFKSNATATLILGDEYAPGLKDLDGFSHAVIIYYFHRSQRESITGRPYLENDEHGIFAIRSPHRPNHIGFSIVKIINIQDNSIVFSEVDMLDGTPVLDIKPYIAYFDSREEVKCGWLEKHFKDGTIPEQTILK